MELGGQRQALQPRESETDSAHPSLRMTKKRQLVALKVEECPHSTLEETAGAFGEGCGHPLELQTLILCELLQIATASIPTQVQSSSACRCPLVDMCSSGLVCCLGGGLSL